MKAKKSKFAYLSNEERDEIEILRSKGYGVRAIARVFGRSPNTISYELARVPSGYKASYAKIYAVTKLKDRRFQWSKIEENPELKAYIIECLKKHWNPDEISGRMKKEKRLWYVSKSAIYSWLETARGEPYKKYLYGERPGRRHKKTGTTGQIRGIVSITERPVGCTNRSRYGHHEDDLMVSGRSGTGGLSTDIERISRYLSAEKVLDLSAQEKDRALRKILDEQKVLSFTFDRGHENANHEQLGVPTYFCAAYHPWEKGSIENANKMIRAFFPKKTDFASVSQKEIDRVVSIINDKPRKILDYRTAREVARAGGVMHRVS